MRRLLPAVLILGAFAFFSNPAFADSFSYSFYDAILPTATATFTYVSPVLITSYTVFQPDTSLYVDQSGRHNIPFSVIFDPAFGVSGAIIVDGSPYFAESITFGSGESFFTVGNHSSYRGNPTLDVTDIPTAPSSPEVPEPSTLALFMTGSIGLITQIRRRILA